MKLFKKPIYNKVKACDICGGHSFTQIKTFPSTEWESTQCFYKEHPEKNEPFSNIRKKHNLMRCKNCGVVFVSPRISDWVVNRWYNEYLSGKYKEFIHDYVQESREPVFEKNLAYIKQFAPQGKLLDIGCATGGFLNIAKKQGFSTFGIEVSDICASKACKYGDVRCGDAVEKLSEFPDEFFDIAASVDSIEHLKSPAALIRMLSKKMKTGGFIFIDTPNADLENDVMSRHFFLFSIGTLSRLLESNGFAVRVAKTSDNVYNENDCIIPNRFIQILAQKI